MDRPDLEALRGAIDMHAHTGPALFPRPLDDRDTAEMGVRYGMRGCVLKDHDNSTTGRAYYVRKMVEGFEPIGSVVLNRSVGGLAPHVVQAAIRTGAKVVFMPTTHAKWHIDYFGMSDYPQFGRTFKSVPVEGITILGEDNQLKPEVLTILDLIADADVCLGTTHLTKLERTVLVEEAFRRGVKKVSITHANWALAKLTVEEQKAFIAMGAYVEYVTCALVSPIWYEQDVKELAGWIKEIGPEKLVLSSDLGSMASPFHAEGLRVAVAALLDNGVPYESLETMLKVNPAKLLNMEVG